MSRGVSPDEEKGAGREVPLLNHSQSLLNNGVSLPGDPTAGDGSELLYSMYSAITRKEDDEMIDRWQKNADSIVLFAGLSSAAVAALLALSVPDLRPNPQDTANFYMQNMNQLLVNLSRPQSSVSSAIAQPPPFSPHASAIWANVFWFLSLGLDLLCAVTATIVQHWVRRYIVYTRPRHSSPRTRARARALFARSIDKLFIQMTSSMLTCCLHLAGALTAFGVLSFLFHINRTVYYTSLGFTIVTVLIHSLFAIVSRFYRDCLLDIPLSRLPSSAFAFVSCFFLTVFSDRFNYNIWRAIRWVFKDGGSGLEELDSKQLLGIDIEVFEETLDSLGEDDTVTVDKFFRAIIGFFDSRFVDIDPTTLSAQTKDKFKRVLNEFVDFTFHSNTITEDVRCFRLIICLDASSAVLGPNESSQILDNILDGKWPKLLQSVEIGHSLRSWGKGSDESNQPYIRSIISRIIANVEIRNSRWTELVMNQLGISEDLLQKYISHGDSVLLADFIDAARRIIVPDSRNPPSQFKYDVSSALPDLQREFCALWNESVQKARNSNDRISILMLKNFRHVYIGLHEGTVASPTAFSAFTTDDHILDNPLSYPPCTIASHHPYPMPTPPSDVAAIHASEREIGISGLSSTSNLSLRYDT